MKAIFNETELNVVGCLPHRYASGKLVLRVTVDQTVIGHDELKALIKSNTGDITVIRDDESQETYSGFNYNVQIIDDETNYICEIECKSELEYQLSLAKKEITTLRAENEALREEIATLTENNTMLTECLLEMSEAVYA